MMGRTRDIFDLVVIAACAMVGIGFAPHPVSFLFFGVAFGLNLGLLKRHVFVRLGRFTWGNKEFDR